MNHKRVIATVATVSLVALLVVVGASQTSAFSVSEVQTEIKGLIAKLQGAAIKLTDCVVPAAPLTFGSYGPEVKKLQVWLNQHGYKVVPAGSESEYFGPLTHFALLRFQAAAGVRPTSGIYGPFTKAEIEKRCASELAAQRGVRLSLAKGTPDSGSFSARVTRTELLRFDISGKSKVEAITVSYIGDPKAIGINELYLFEGDVRLTSGQEIDPKTMTATFTDLDLTLEGTRTLSVFASLSAVNEFYRASIEITSAAAIIADGAIAGSFPITSEEFSRDPEKAPVLAMTKDGVLKETIVGERAVQVAGFEFTPESKEDVELRTIGLTLDGNLDNTHVSNFVLKNEGVPVAFASAVNAHNQVVLRFEKPFLVAASSPESFELYADLSSNIPADTTLKLYVAELVDVEAVSVESGLPVQVASAKYNNSARNGTDASWLPIKGGLVTYMFRGPAVSHYAVGSNDVELMRLDIAAKEHVEFRRIRFMLTAGGADATGTLLTSGGLCKMAEANYRDIKLVDALTGEILGYGQTSGCSVGSQDTNREFVFFGNWQVAAGNTRTVKLTADVGTFVPAESESIRAALMAFEREDIRSLSESDWLNVREVVPQGSILGAAHRVYADESAAAAGKSLALIAPADAHE